MGVKLKLSNIKFANLRKTPEEPATITVQCVFTVSQCDQVLLKCFSCHGQIITDNKKTERLHVIINMNKEEKVYLEHCITLSNSVANM